MPELPKRVHIIGICGRATAGLAAELCHRGCRVTGSDIHVFPPLDAWLESRGITFHRGYAARQVPKDADLVISGPLAKRDHPECRSARRKKIPVLAWPDFVGRHLCGGRGENLVVTGTNGKSTTTAMLAWILDRCHADAPVDRLVGGLCRDGSSPVRWRGSRLRVLEGDEFPVALDDPTPKFMHYRPHIGVVTNVSHDHCEIFSTAESYENAFIDFASLIPRSGALVLHAGDTSTPRLQAACRGRVVTVGPAKNASHRVTGIRHTSAGVRFRLNGVAFALILSGKFNAMNAAMAATAAEIAGVPLESAAAALRSFPGLWMRQEVHSDHKRLTLIEDEAAHPESLTALLTHVRQRYPGRRLVLVFQPRLTGGRDDPYQRELPRALSIADVVLALPAWGWNVTGRTPFDDDLLARATRRLGARWLACRDQAKLAGRFGKELGHGDVVVVSLGFRREALRDDLLRRAGIADPASSPRTP
jgi:UDP-N-acetylmuramate: L-alanyl-gamma-D-glutamyl-meso-diaminopimelate ligase